MHLRYCKMPGVPKITIRIVACVAPTFIVY